MPPKSSVADGVKWFKFATGVFKDQRDREKDDLKCQTPEGMWPDDIKKMRQATTINGIAIPARPMISVPTMDEPVQLVLSGQRKAHLGAKFHPLSEDASDDTAEVLQGLFRNYERDGLAHIARSWAFDRKAKCGTGWWRMLKVFDPEGGHPLDQKLIPKRILYQNAVVPDPFAEEPDWSDGKRLMYVADIALSTFKERYPKSKIGTIYTDDQSLVSLGNEAPGWIGGTNEESRSVRVAEDWLVEIEVITHLLLDDNSMAPTGQIPEGRTVKTGRDARSKDEEKRHLWHRKITCTDTLEPWQEQDGQYIPFIFDPGRELQPVDGKRIWFGMYSTAKQPAQLVNFAASGAVEMAALEPKAPWQAEEGVFEGHELEYQQSNIRNFPYLQHRGRNLSGEKAEAPKRVQADVSRLGPSMELLSMGRDFVQAATSTFDPALGKQPTAHRSGRALIALQDQTVEGTSHYLADHAEIAMTHEARMWLDQAPYVYDRPGRIARMLDEHGDSTTIMLGMPFTTDPTTKRPMPVDPNAPPPADPTSVKHYDLSKGRYGVSVTIGKSSSSRLQEGSDEMSQILQADPALMPIIGPEYFKFRDFPGAKTIAKLLLKMRNHTMPWLSDDPTQNPEAQLAAAQQTMQQMQQALAELQKEKDGKVVENQGKFAIAQMQEESESKRAAQDREVKLAVAELSAKVERLALFMEERARLGEQGHNVAETAAQHEHEAALADQQHANDLQAADQQHQQAIVQNEQTQSHGLETTAAQPPEPPPTEG